MGASTHPTPIRVRALRAILATGVLLAGLAGVTPATGSAEVLLAPQVPHWSLDSRTAPTNLQREGEGPLNGQGMIVASVANLGDAPASGRIEIVDKLPAGIVATGVQIQKNAGIDGGGGSGFVCSQASGPEIACSDSLLPIPPYGQELVEIAVRVEKGAPAEGDNELSVSGGGAVPASTPLRRPVRVNGSPTMFGLDEYAFEAETSTFSPDVQAGTHPFQLTTTFDLNDIFVKDVEARAGEEVKLKPHAPALPKDFNFELPAGLVGNVNVTPQCSDLDFGAYGEAFVDSCPNNTAVGVAAVVLYNIADHGEQVYVVPVFNLVPSPGEPAKFGINVDHVPVVLDTAVRTGEDYGVTVSVHDVPQALQLLASKVTFWGVPGDPRHNASRGWACLGYKGGEKLPVEPCDLTLKPAAPPPFLTLPTSCGPLDTRVEGEAWNAAELQAENKQFKFPSTKSSSPLEPPLTGCEALPFDPSIEVKPDKHEASTPTGMTVKVNVPQGPTLESTVEGGHAEQDVRSTKLELPIGLQASPAAATGLLSCSVEQAGFNGSNGDSGGTLEAELSTQGFTPAAASCPDAAKIGTVNIKTPLLEEEVIGNVYLASQNTNPFGSPLVLYIIAKEKKSEVLVKLAGEVQLNGETGQLISDFRNTPETPFETLTLHLTDGDRASQATPAFCGEYHATATFNTWSDESSTTRESNPSEFKIDSGPNGTACPGSKLPFAPRFQAGSTNQQGGAYTPFTLTIAKPDGQQALESITAQLPPGMAAKIAAVTPCPNPAAIEALPTISKSAPPCGPESLIGHTTSSSGLGGKPVTLPGNLYLTEGVHGAPFGLLASTEGRAGPFFVGWVNVLSTITINETTAAVTTKTVNSLPRIVDGVPVQLKQINVVVERPGNTPFQFNPTNCSPMAVTGSLGGWEGANDAVSFPFVASNCAALPFKPVFTASTSAHTSKTEGASLNVKVTYPQGLYANIAKVETDLPLALPSRLETIQKACLDTVFEASPTKCPEASQIGKGIAHTPVLRNPLEGTAYLVSHGGRAFPDLEIVLKGQGPESGVKIVLDGQTDIKKGITKTTFAAVPDAPVESFELNLPQGPHSALGTSVHTNLCKPTTTAIKVEHITRRVKGHLVHSTKKVTVTVPEALVIPTTITAQNGAVIRQRTPVLVNGCAAVKGFKAKSLTRAQKLAKALKACKKKPKAKRPACEKQARKSYGPLKKASTKKK